MSFNATKDPSEILDYGIDYSRPFNASTPVDAISTTGWVIENNTSTDPLVIDSNTHDGIIATVWLSGGRKGATYRVVNTITTTGGRTYERTIRVKLLDK